MAWHQHQQVVAQHLVGLANVHVFAMLPVVLCCEPGVARVVVVAQEALALAVASVRGAGSLLVELSYSKVLGAEMPVDVDGAQALLKEWLGDGNAAGGIKLATVSLGHVGASLLKGLPDTIDRALDVRKVIILHGWISMARLLTLAQVDATCKPRACLGRQQDLLPREGTTTSVALGVRISVLAQLQHCRESADRKNTQAG